MAKFEASVMIDRPVEKVWKFVTDLSKLPKWNTEVLEAKETSAGPLGVGTTLQVRSSNMVGHARVVEYELNRRAAFEYPSGPLKGTMERSSVENVEGKTRFTRTADLKFSGVYKQLIAGMESDTHDRLPQIKAPTLILCGRKDILVPSENGPILAEAIPNAKLVYFEKSAHALTEEMNEVIHVITEFLL
jgi:pimeloyl-ACP methyl ester carboxylesterase